MKQPRRLTLALILAAVCTAGGAGPARGATYTVESCSNGSLSGWSAFQHGLFSGWVATTRLAATGGTFAYRPPSRTGRVRALVRSDPGWPFLTAHSRAVRVSR